MRHLTAAALGALLFVAPSAAEKPAQVRIPIRLNVPAFAPAGDWPLSVSVPFPPDTLDDAAAAILVDSKGNPIPCQKEVLASWTPRGNVKWLELSFVGNPEEAYAVVLRSGRPSSESAAPVRVTRAGNAADIDAGLLRAIVDANGRLRIAVRGAGVLDAADGFLCFTANDGRQFRAAGAGSQTQMKIEAPGPEKAVIRLEGWYVDAKEQQCGRHITRLHFFRDQPLVKIIHTFVITENTNKVWFKDLGLHFPLKLAGPVSAVLDRSSAFDSDAVTQAVAEGEAASLFQEVYRHHGEEAARGIVGIVRAGKMNVLAETDRVGEWAALRGREHTVTAVIRDLWQTFPKEIEVRPDALRVHLFSNRGGRELDFRAPTLVKYWGKWGTLYRRGAKEQTGLLDKPSDAAGLARTHEVWLFFHPAETKTETIARAAHVVQEPILALPDPKWNCASGIFGPLSPCDSERFPREERLVSEFFDWMTRFGERFGHWGFLEYGVVHAMVYGRGDLGAQRLAATDDKKWRAGFYRYGRSRYGFMQNAWHLYLRSGERKYHDVARIMSNHLMDIQMVHWDLPQKFRGGYATGSWTYLHWHTPMMWGTTAPDKALMTYGILAMLVNEYLYPYHITGQRRAMDVVGERLEAVKRYWKFEELESREERSKYSMLANLSALYSFSWDKKILDLIDRLRPQLVDRDSLFGLRHRTMDSYGMPEASYVVHYLPRKAAWALEFAEAMQSPEDRAAALRAIRHAYEINAIDGSYSALGRDYASYYLATGDEDVLWRLRQLVDEKLSTYWDAERDCFNAEAQEQSGRVSPMHLAGSVMATVPYALTALAHAPQSALDREMIMAREALLNYCGVATSPMYVKTEPGTTTVLDVFAVGEMAWGSGAPLQVRSSRRPGPGAVWVDTHSTPTQGGTISYYMKYYHRVVIGPGESADWYRLTPGYGASYRVVGPVGLPTVVRVPREGVVIGKSVLRTPDIGAKWFFHVPKGTASFKLQADGPIRVSTPDGKWAREFDTDAKQTVISVPQGLDDKVWGLQSRDHLTRVQFDGIPPFLAFGSARRFFLPKGWQEQANVEWPRPEPGTAAYWEGRSLSHSDKALYLGAGAHLRVPLSDATAEALAEAGTIEMWFRPNFNSESLPDRSTAPFASSADGSSFLLYAAWNKQHRVESTFNNWGHHFYGRVATGKIDAMRWVNMTFVAGEWTHLAVTWKAEESDVKLTLFVNGKMVKTRERSAWKRGLLIDWGDALFIGRRPGQPSSLHGVVDELRVSGTARYAEGFIPTTGPLPYDEDTLFLFHLDGNTNGVGKDESEVRAELTDGAK